MQREMPIEGGVLRVVPMRLYLLTFVLLPLTASAQLFNFGVQGGVPAQTPLGQTRNMPFALGPSVDIHVLSGLSLETGLLYHRIGRSTENFAFLFPENAITLGQQTSHGSAWELPFLAKYRLLSQRARWRPFLTAGPTVRRTSIASDSVSTVFNSSPQSFNANPQLSSRTSRWNLDPTAGVGVDVQTGRFHLEPEVRYSYWGAGKNGPIRKNQVNFLLGFRL